jgi:hypothetical protein
MFGSKKLTIIIFFAVLILFAVSWIFRSTTSQNSIGEAFLLTMSAFLTLAILSFLYKDNPYYKFAEHLFIGVSAAYWMCVGFWSTFVGNFLPRVSSTLSAYFGVPYKEFDIFYFVPIFLGVLLLMRLSPKGGWLSRWSLAFIVGTTAGLNLIRYLRSDFINQVGNTFVPVLVGWKGIGPFFSEFSLSPTGQFALSLSNFVIFAGVFCGLIYFFFSKEHKGLFGTASRLGIWILMITFGASFGYTVMGRVSLLVGRLTFLFHDWLGLIN